MIVYWFGVNDTILLVDLLLSFEKILLSHKENSLYYSLYEI